MEASEASIAPEDPAIKEDGENGKAKKAPSRVSFMAIAASPTLQRAAMVQSQGIFGGESDEGVISAIAADPKEESNGDAFVLMEAVAAAVLRESHVDDIIYKRMLQRAQLVRRTLERCSKSLKEAAKLRHQCTMSANSASRSLYNYIARLNQGQDVDSPYVVVRDESSEVLEEDASVSGGSSDRDPGSESEFMAVGQTFLKRLERVIIPPSSIEVDESARALLLGSHKLIELSKAIQSVVRDLESHQKSCPSASEILRVKETMRDLTGLATAKDPWIAECEYNVLLRQALQANRERRGLCERLTELVEQKQVTVLHNAISAMEATCLEGRRQTQSLEADLSDRLARASADKPSTSPASGTNQAGNSVDALLEQRLVECAGALFDQQREDVVRAGVLEMRVAGGGGSQAQEPASSSDSDWQTVRAVITRGGNFCYFSDLIPTPSGLDGLLVPDNVIPIGQQLSVEPDEAPHFDLVESGGWGRSKKRHKFRATTIEDSVEWILVFKDLKQV